MKKVVVQYYNKNGVIMVKMAFVFGVKH